MIRDSFTNTARASRVSTTLVLVLVLATVFGAAVLVSSPVPLPAAPHHITSGATGSLFVGAFEVAHIAPACEARDELRAEFVKVATSPPSVQVDSIDLVPFLRRFYMTTPRQLLIDVGANIGDTSAALMQVLCPTQAFGVEDAIVKSVARCFFESGASPRGGRVLAYEPVPANYALLNARADAGNWRIGGWEGFAMAATSPAQAPVPGAMVKFFSSRVAGDQQGGLAANSSYVTEADFELVAATTLDRHLEFLGEGRSTLLLLKVDAEGFDVHVLRGAERVLRENRATFIIFEYNWKWKAGADNLQDTVSWMHGFSYFCWLMTPSHLIPLTGRWWDPAYEMWRWSNVVCALEYSLDSALLLGYFMSASFAQVAVPSGFLCVIYRSRGPSNVYDSVLYQRPHPPPPTCSAEQTRGGPHFSASYAAPSASASSASHQTGALERRTGTTEC